MSDKLFGLTFLQIAGASVFGILLSKYPLVACLKLAAGLLIPALPITVAIYLALFCMLSAVPCAILLIFFLSNLGVPHMVNQQAICWCS